LLFKFLVVNIVYSVYTHYRLIYFLEVSCFVDIIIATKSKVPLFQQIKEQIKQQIFTGKLVEGDALPSMRTLAKDLKVSVITTKRAYEELEREGYVISTVGRGTFVAGQQPHVLKEWQMRELENELEKVVHSGKQMGISKEEMIELLKVYYEEDL